MQTRLWNTMGIPAKSDRHCAFSKLSLMPHQLLYPLKSTQLYSSAVSNSAHSFTQQTLNESRWEGHGCVQLDRGGAFRMDWLDLLAVQGTLKSLLQHHSSKASILRPLGHVCENTLVRGRTVSVIKQCLSLPARHLSCLLPSLWYGLP